MIYAKVNPETIEVLETELKNPKDGNWYRRVKIIHLSSQGYTVPQLSRFFDLSCATVRDYIKRYNQGGLAALKPNYSNGRPLKINLSKEEWEELLHQSPCQFEKLHTGAQNWTQQMLRKYLALYHHVLVAQSTISTLIRRLGIRWNRGKLKVTSPDPLYQVKRERIRSVEKKSLQGKLNSHDVENADLSVPAKPAQLVFFDSTDLHWCPDVGFGYTVMAEQIKVASPGVENPWCALFGSIIYPTGEGLYTIHERKRHQEVEVYLKLLIQEEPETFWFVVMDNASAHTTPMLDDFWSVNQDKIQAVYQPTYSPHLNLIEKLWRLMRGQMTKNYFYPNLRHLCEAVINWLEKLPFSQFCSLMGIDESTLEFV